jgi:hypothetical protein
MPDSAIELYFEHSKSQAQFAYFQLGVAASAIAFAVHETTGKSLANTPWLIGLGVILWAASFALGCFGVDAHQRAMRTNIRFLRATKGASNYAVLPDIATALEEATAIAERDANRPMSRYRWQMWMLFAGALAYVSGHIVMMAATSPAPAVQVSATAKSGR